MYLECSSGPFKSISEKKWQTWLTLPFIVPCTGAAGSVGMALAAVLAAISDSICSLSTVGHSLSSPNCSVRSFSSFTRSKYMTSHSAWISSYSIPGDELCTGKRSAVLTPLYPMQYPGHPFRLSFCSK